MTTRRATNARSSSLSLTGSSSPEPANASVPRRLATSSTARWSAEEKGLETSSSSSPIEAVFWSDRRCHDRVAVISSHDFRMSDAVAIMTGAMAGEEVRGG
jgi:hypothetical protein